MSECTPKIPLWDWVKAFSTLALVSVIVIKIYITPTSITIDFPILISLLLALFSVALSALFYFKATDSSNTFYDNTYKFTKDIAELLTKMESGFGEKLRHLDEGYSSMQNHLQNITSKPSEDIEKTKQRIESEKQEVEKVLSERNEIVQHLLEKSQLHKEEKDKIIAQLQEKEQELSQSQSEISRLNRRLSMERVVNRSNRVESHITHSGMAKYTFEHVILPIGVEKVLDMPSRFLVMKFDNLSRDLSRAYIRDLEKQNFYTTKLTDEGVSYIKSIAERFRTNDA